jgi:hypothetical protein
VQWYNLLSGACLTNTSSFALQQWHWHSSEGADFCSFLFLLPLSAATMLMHGDTSLRCRAQHARLAGYGSFYSMTQQRLQAAAASSSQLQDSTQHRIGFLIQLQEALDPLCQQEVAWVAGQASRRHSEHPGQLDNNHTHQQQQEPDPEQQQQQHNSPQHAEVGSDILQATATLHNTGHCSEQGVGSPAHLQTGTLSETEQQSGPADWDYMLYQAILPYRQSLQHEAAVLQQHLQLSGVVAGFDRLLQDVICVRLVPRQAAAAAAAADLWAPHILVLDLFDAWNGQDALTAQQQQQQEDQLAADSSKQVHSSQQGGRAGQLLGTVYVDVGGGYGTRMLRYARNVPGSGSSTAAGCAAHTLPAAAVGISGSRLPPVSPQGQKLAGTGARPTGTPAAPPAAPAAAVAAAVDTASAVTDQAAGGGQVEAWESSLSVSQLWELAHELGHAVHLVASSR